MPLHRAGHFQLLREGLLRAGQQVVHLFVGGLEADLDMVQPGFGEAGDLLFGQADARGDQVGVVTQPAGRLDQLGQVLAHQRLATGKTQLRRAHLPRLAEHLDPLGGTQLLMAASEIQRVGAVRALQRAAVGQLGEQPQRRTGLVAGLNEARSRTVQRPPPRTPGCLLRCPPRRESLPGARQRCRPPSARHRPA